MKCPRPALGYARWSARTLVRHGKPYEAAFGTTVGDEVVLEKPNAAAATETVSDAVASDESEGESST